ncbi:MAG: ATP-binding protein [Flavipsychrobacter sp.]|nr:ATP-binding protein [Flavipsychrobacter sp.]
MNEITNVGLENEMDLILAHKQAMRLAELAGLSLSAQTTFATAVSEVSRYAIGRENHACLRLYVSDKAEKIKFIFAVLEDKRPEFVAAKDDGYIYAKRLVSNISISFSQGLNKTELSYRLPLHTRIDNIMVEKWRTNLNTDPAISPYEEIKRKNKQLIELADKLRESEQQYISLTNSLPIMIFTMNVEGMITYANQWLHSYSGATIEEINDKGWQHVAHADDLKNVLMQWEQSANDPDTIISPELRLKDVNTGEYRWHTGVSIPINNDDGTVRYRNTYMVDVHAQKMIEEAFKDNLQLKDAQSQLEEKVRLLNQSNEQLEQFAYVASHDLQEPLRKISFYSDILKRKYGQEFSGEAAIFFDNLINATGRMRSLIQDVLTYSTVRSDGFTMVDLNNVFEEVLYDLEIVIKEKQAQITIGTLPVILGNPRQLKQLFENLVSNGLKFSKQNAVPVIKISAQMLESEVVLSFEDEGIGFDEKYIGKMFSLFQRLHDRDKYTGTGIGLAICKKIVELHQGSISAQGQPDQGATFLITLPLLEQQVN